MPLPLIIGAAALAAAGFGAKKGYTGYRKHSEADDIVDQAKKAYNEQREIFDEQENKSAKALVALGKLELKIGKSFEKFKNLADDLIAQVNASSRKKLEIDFPERELKKIENYSFSAVSVLGSVAGAGAAGAAAGFAVYGGVMALGAASTGTAISSLAGVAATNATLAALGGGSLAAGGLGMAGGTAVLGTAVAAPILAIAGWAYDSHGEAALKNARKASREAKNAIEKLGIAQEFLKDTEGYANRIKRSLSSIYRQFQRYHDDLAEVDQLIEKLKNRKGRKANVEAEFRKLGPSIEVIVHNGYSLAAILTSIITTPLYQPKKVNRKISLDADGRPEMLQDENGMMLLNGKKIDKALSTATAQSAEFD
jgi:hypothetical protein